ncbi:16269_t:CDS:2, partial [Racocetra fulgida]
TQHRLNQIDPLQTLTSTDQELHKVEMKLIMTNHVIEDQNKQERDQEKHQFEYNALCAIGNDLDMALSATFEDEAIRFVESAHAKTADRTVVLNVAKEYGWEVATALPQSKNEDLVEYGINHTEDETLMSQTEKEVDHICLRRQKLLTIVQEKETHPSHAITAEESVTMQIIVSLDLINIHQNDIHENRQDMAHPPRPYKELQCKKTEVLTKLAINNKELIEMDRYVCFDNIAEGSMQALPNNDIKEKTDNETLTYQDSENPDNDMPESSEFAADKDNENNDCEVLDNETISIQAPQGVQNPPRIIGRGRPSKCRFMSSIEKKQNQGKTSSRGLYKCRQCGEEKETPKLEYGYADLFSNWPSFHVVVQIFSNAYHYS